MSKKNNQSGKNQPLSNGGRAVKTSKTLNNIENSNDAAESTSDGFLPSEPVQNAAAVKSLVNNGQHKTATEAVKHLNRDLNIEDKSQSNKEKKSRKSQQPRRLGEKLARIRLHHGLTQGSMLQLINPYEDENGRARVSQYENGKRTPSIAELLNYARFANVSIEVLADDNLDLPPGF